MRIRDDSEAPVVVDVAPRIHELRVVKDVEEFDEQIKRYLLAKDSSLQYAEVRVVEPGAVEEMPVRGTKCSWRGAKGKCTLGLA